MLLLQTTLLKKGMAGFIFESNRGTQHTFASQAQLEIDFVKAATSGKALSNHKTKEVGGKLLSQLCIHLDS